MNTKKKQKRHEYAKDYKEYIFRMMNNTKTKTKFLI